MSRRGQTAHVKRRSARIIAAVCKGTKTIEAIAAAEKISPTLARQAINAAGFGMMLVHTTERKTNLATRDWLGS